MAITSPDGNPQTYAVFKRVLRYFDGQTRDFNTMMPLVEEEQGDEKEKEKREKRGYVDNR